MGAANLSHWMQTLHAAVGGFHKGERPFFSARMNLQCVIILKSSGPSRELDSNSRWSTGQAGNLYKTPFPPFNKELHQWVFKVSSNLLSLLVKWVVETIFKRLTNPGWVTELTNLARFQSPDSIHTEELDLSPQAAAQRAAESLRGTLCCPYTNPDLGSQSGALWGSALLMWRHYLWF